MEKLFNVDALKELNAATEAAKTAEDVKMKNEWATVSTQIINQIDFKYEVKKNLKKADRISAKIRFVSKGIFVAQKEWANLSKASKEASKNLAEVNTAIETVKSALNRALQVGLTSPELKKNLVTLHAKEEEIRKMISTSAKSMNELVLKAAHTMYFIINKFNVEPIGLNLEFVKAIHAKMDQIEKGKKAWAARNEAAKAATEAARSFIPSRDMGNNKNEGYNAFKDLLK